MLLIDDDALYPFRASGRAVHATVALLAARTLRPTILDIEEAVREVQQRQPHGRAVRQNVIMAAGRYFHRLLPPDEFHLVGAEIPLGPGRVDLVWQHHRTRALLVDEIKSGRVGLVPQDLTQAATYAQDAAELCHEPVLGVRLLSICKPSQSLFVTPRPTFTPLHESGYLHGAVR